MQAKLLVADALAILQARPDYTSTILPTFNSLTTYDDNTVVAFNVFFAGPNSGVWSYGLWPGASALNTPVPLGNGKILWRYQMTDMGAALELGTFCHENGHSLCQLPDVYDYDYDSAGGAGLFCLMNSGGHGTNPAQICAYLKNAAGWATTTDIDSTSNLTGTLVAAPSTGFNHFYRYRRPGVATEYFLLENRQPTGRDAGLPGGGIAVWHVDELGDHNNQSLVPNSTHANYEVTLVQADNRWHFENNSNEGDASDLFYQGNPALGYANRLDDTSAPNAHWWDGTTSGLNANTFTAQGASMTFQVGTGGTTVPAPVLSPEPPVTAGTSNTIYWTPGKGQGWITTESVKQAESCSAILDESAPQPQSWQNILNETFESGFPGTGWRVTSSPTWDDTTYSFHSGSRSAWCGASPLDPAGGYANNMNAWMIYGPFSLADATDATVNFWYKNNSESGYDFFKWFASIDNLNFYGIQTSGDQSAWRSQAFSLTNVYTLGNLCGKSQVWIAFVFTSDGSWAGDKGYSGAYVDDVVIQKYVTSGGGPDLQPYQLAGWNDKLPISATQLYGTNAHTYTGPFSDSQPLYFNWASINRGGAPCGAYQVHVEVSGTGGGSWNWNIPTNTVNNYYFLTQDQVVGPLATGNHTFKLWVDYNSTVTETNETNNYYERTISVGSTTTEYYAECANNANFNLPLNSGWLQPSQYTFLNLTAGQTYWYRVKARQGGQESAWSNVEHSQQEALSPVIAVSPSSLSFGTIPVNTTAEQTFTVSNSGAGTLVGNASVAAPFSIVSGGSYSLGASAAQAVVLRYSPTAAGSNYATVSFTGGGGTTRLVTGAATNPAVQTVTIAGAVSYYAPPPSPPGVTAVTMNLTGDTNRSVQTGSNGQYSFGVNADGSYVLTPTKLEDTTAANGITTMDISLIRRHILGIAALDSPYKLLAADVNDSDSVSTMDITFMRRLILGLTNGLPAGLWRFVPAGYAWPDPLNPWTAPNQLSYANLTTDALNQNFTAIKLGDVNNSWTASAGQQGLCASATALNAAAALPRVSLQVSSHSVQPGTQVSVGVSAQASHPITSVQFTLEWDPAVLEYLGTADYALPGLSDSSFGTPLTAQGKLMVSWDDPNATGVALVANTTLFTVKFQVIGKADATSLLALANSITPCEIGVDCAPAALQTQNGQVRLIALPDRPRLLQPAFVQGNFRVSVATEPGARYILEFADTLSNTGWTALPAVTGDGTVQTLTAPTGSSQQRFFRVRME